MALSAVAFHFNVPQRQDYTCRLLRKAHRAGARVVVSAAPETLAKLDRALWLYDALEFVPHWRGAAIERLPARLKDTPIVLLERPSPAGGHGVLVNLGDEVPEAVADFDRVIEIVGRAEDDRARARERWRRYGALGVAIERHEFKA